MNKNEIAISDIIIGNRFRKDFGDIETFAKSIEEVGLLHPIVIDEKKNLIAGGRRIKAFEYLKRNAIPYTIVNMENIILGEFHENQQRKELTVEEEVALLQAIRETRIGHRPEKGSNLAPFPKGKSVDVLAKYTGKSPETLRREEFIIKKIKEEPEKFGHILDNLNTKSTSVNSAYNTILSHTIPEIVIPLPEEKHNVIYIDPPWQYNNVNTGGSMNSGSANKYPTMSLDKLIDFDIPKLAAKDSAIFMWCTVQMTPDGLKLLDRWGFKFNGMIFWHKNSRKGMGNWWSNVVEFIMFGVQGDVKPFRSSIPNFLSLPVLSHSEKPQEFRKMIEDLTQYMPDRKMIEVFARRKVLGWKYYGNQLLPEKDLVVK